MCYGPPFIALAKHGTTGAARLAVRFLRIGSHFVDKTCMKKPAALTVTFLGAAGTVTGSKYLVTTPHARVLVDCGLFQGLKQLRLRNWRPLPLDVEHIDAVVLTHAHIDHTGGVPLLVKQGYGGPVYCTPATQALCRILLPDAG